MDFVAYDFETANSNRATACSLGAVKVHNGKISDQFYTLIDPHAVFDQRNINVHGIYPKDVMGAPMYPDAIFDFHSFTSGLPVVSHTTFDVGVITSANMRYQIKDFELDYFDSCQLARTIWKQRFQRFGLGPLSRELGIEFNHHNALEDARAAAIVILNLAEDKNATTVAELIQSAGYSHLGRIQGTQSSGFKKSSRSVRK